MGSTNLTPKSVKKTKKMVRVAILGWVGSASAKGLRALRRVAAHHESNGRTVVLVRPTTVYEAMTVSGNLSVRAKGVLPANIDLVHSFSAGSLVLWNARHELGSASVVFDSGPIMPSAKIVSAWFAWATRTRPSPFLERAVRRAWDATGYEGIYGPSDDMPRVYERVVAGLVDGRAALVVRGESDAILDADAEAARAAERIERVVFPSGHVAHLRAHTEEYESSMRALLARR